MSAVLQSIQQVSDLVKSKIEEDIPKLKIITQEELPPELPFPIKNSQAFKSIRTLSQAVSEVSPIVEYEYVDKASLFSFLLKTASENFHSDFIASLLDSRRSGVIAQKLFAEIINYAIGEKIQVQGYISAQREVELKKLVKRLDGTTLGSRRIDILAYSEEFTIVIENKVYSLESESQTQDYHDCVREQNLKLHNPKRVVEILLSPTGLEADCPHYQSMSYHDLFLMLLNIHRENPIQPVECANYFKMYLDSLYEQHYLRQIDYLNFLKEFWRNR